MLSWFRSFSIACAVALLLPFSVAGAAGQPQLVVVVYPLVPSQSAPAVVGEAVARVLVNGITQRGGVVAKAAPPTAQADYLQTARGLGADYYVAGFVSTIGSEVSAIEQLVATKSGVVVWQNTAAYTVPEDARASGAAIHDAIMALNTPQFVQPSGVGSSGPPPTSAPVAPTPSRRTAAVSETPLPIPKSDSDDDAPDAVVDGPRVVIVDFGGSALDAIKHYVPSSIKRTLPRYHMSGTALDLRTADIAANGLVACAQAGADYLMGGAIAAGEDGDPGMGYSVGTDLVLDVYDCRHMQLKPRVIEKQTSNGNAQTSVDIAVDQALRDFANQVRTATATH